MSDRFRVIGGVPLHGDVRLSGSKNGALPILAASLLVEGVVVLHNVPFISDIEKMSQLIALLGARVEWQGTTVRIDASTLTTQRADRDLTAAMRASFDVVAPLLARFHCAEVPLPGGCAIGSRPVDYVIQALEGLGVITEERSDVVICTAPHGLQGATVTLDPIYRSPRATFAVAMAAARAKGRTIIENASSDPEVEKFCEFLIAAGTHIEGIGSTRLVIEGCEHLHSCEHTIMSDRIEAGTYLLAAAATHGEIRVHPINPVWIASLLDKLEEMGGLTVLREEEAVTVRYDGRPHGTTIYTMAFPGFPTDLQPAMVVLMCLAAGRSAMHETIYDRRLNYVNELRRMGAKVKLVNSQQAEIEGIDQLQGREVEGADMRGGAALVVAALAAEGESLIAGRHYIIRGYEHLEDKLTALGARITVDSGA